jgi:diacylglycerol kinase family enzyme
MRAPYKNKIGIHDTKSKFNEFFLILNPNSQGGATGRNWDQTYNKIKEFLPRSHQIIFTRKANEGSEITRNLLREGFKNIAAVGGDGTLNEIANGFFEFKIQGHVSFRNPDKLKVRLELVNPEGVLWIIPSGTRNVLAASLGLKHRAIDAFMHIKHMKKRSIDVIGVILTDNKNHRATQNRILLNAAEIGFGAEIIDRAKKVRSKVKSRLLSTAAGIISTVPTYESNESEVIIDGTSISTKLTMAVVANGNYLGGGFNAAPRASMSDGLLDLVITKNSGSFKILNKLIPLRGDSQYSDQDDILYYQASQVLLKSKQRQVTLTLDGEPVGILPAVFRVYENILNIKVER